MNTLMNCQGKKFLPKAGFKSITVSEEVYDWLFLRYNSLKENDTLPFGIHSFSAYFEYVLSERMEEVEKLHEFASKITTVPEKFTETKIILKQ